MTARLHVLLGAGGVGKTTLAAAYAIALARSGRRVGLLGIDPARRLQGALGLELTDLEVPVPSAGDLSAALLRPDESLRRWAIEATADPGARARLLANPFFVALADRLASATDLLAGVRIAEWLERDPNLEDLVVDTAPGLNAIEFLRRPERLQAFLRGRLVRWLRWLSRTNQSGRIGELRGRAQRALGGLARIGGAETITALGELLSLIEAPFVRMGERLARARELLRAADLVLVTAVRDDAAATARAIAAALAELGMSPRAAVVNRALPVELGEELLAMDETTLSPDARAVCRYARANAAMQARTIEAVGEIAPVVVIGAASGLAADARFEALAALGARLSAALAAGGRGR